MSVALCMNELSEKIIGNVIGIVGPRGCGFTVLCKHIIQWAINDYKINNAFIITNSDSYNNFIQKENIIEPNNYKSFLNYLKDTANDSKKIVCIDYIDIDKFKELIYNGRHLNITVIYSSQSPSIKSDIASNTSFFYISNYNLNSTTKSIFDKYMFHGFDYRTFCIAATSISQNGFLFIDHIDRKLEWIVAQHHEKINKLLPIIDFTKYSNICNNDELINELEKVIQSLIKIKKILKSNNN
jgi:ABC-type dipeptide/oligopeptide/nickel transport system ATPase component